MLCMCLRMCVASIWCCGHFFSCMHVSKLNLFLHMDLKEFNDDYKLEDSYTESDLVYTTNILGNITYIQCLEFSWISQARVGMRRDKTRVRLLEGRRALNFQRGTRLHSEARMRLRVCARSKWVFSCFKSA